MEMLIIIPAAAVIAMIFIFVFLRANRNKYAKQNEKYSEFEKRRNSALWATARVANILDGITGENAEKTLMHLTLEVTPPGGQPYRARSHWLIDLPELSSFSQGSEIQVRIDSLDPGIIYPGSEHAAYIPD